MKFYKAFASYKIIFWACMLFFTFLQEVKAQEQLWFNGGISLSMGVPVRRVGVFFQTYYHYQQVQSNFEIHLNYQWATLGPSQKGWELQTGLGAVFFWGKPQRSRTNPFFSLISQQAQQPYSAGYAYKYYWDSQQTSQSSGVIGLQFNDFQVVIENDILGKFGEDKFRTATFLVQYQDTIQQIGVKTMLWTGDPFGVTHGNNASYPARYGYLNMNEAKYGNFSHGILTAYYRYWWENQILATDIGFDSEKVRHVLQNRLIHDLFFIPKRWNKVQNTHIPMIDTEGKPYLFLEEQQIRKTKPYFMIGANPMLFY